MDLAERDFKEGFSVRDALKLPCLAGAKVLAGEKGLDREVKFVTVMDAPGGPEWYRGGELMLSSGYFLSKETKLQDNIISELARWGVAAFGMKLKRFIGSMPAQMVKQANELGIPLIELPYSIAWVDVISPVLAEVLQSQSRTLQISKESHERLTKLVLQGGGLSDIVKELSAIIGKPAFITDRHFKCIASSRPGEDGISCELTPDQTRKAWADGQPLDNSLLPNSRRSDGIAIVPVTSGDNVYAYLVISDKDEDLTKTSLTIIEDASTVCALEIVSRNAITEVERRFRNNFVEDLVLGNFDSRQVMLRRATSFDWDLTEPQVVLNIDFDGFERYYVEQQAYNDKAMRDAKNRFVRIVESIPKRLNRGLLGADKSDSMIVLLSFDKGTSATEAYKNALRVGDFIREEVSKSITPLTVSVGIGRLATDVEHIPASYRQATQALVLGRRVFGGNRCTHFDDLGIFRVISERAENDEQEEFCKEWISPVAEYDETRGTSLIQTLLTYYKSNMNIQESAKKLYIHENTMRYRLNKIEEVLGTDLSKGENLLNLWTALKLYLAKEANQLSPSGSAKRRPSLQP